jgi:transposase
MESTGQYWRPLWNILEGEVPRLVLVNPAHVKALAGRKTDRIDSQRLARYLESRELDGSFVPSREIRELRDLTRARVHLLAEVNRVKNRLTQMCEAGNIKVSSVASDLFGVSGRRMLAALGEGRRDAGWMADYARGTLRNKKRQLERALDGSFTAHQRWLLREELGHLGSLERQIERVEEEIERQMQPYEEHLRRLATIPGIDRITAWTLLAELGPDMSVFPDADHAASWAGMCPGNRVTGGKRLSGRTRKANPYVRRDLCQAAWAASHRGEAVTALLPYQRNLFERFVPAVASQIRTQQSALRCCSPDAADGLQHRGEAVTALLPCSAGAKIIANWAPIISTGRINRKSSTGWSSGSRNWDITSLCRSPPTRPPPPRCCPLRLAAPAHQPPRRFRPPAIPLHRHSSSPHLKLPKPFPSARLDVPVNALQEASRATIKTLPPHSDQIIHPPENAALIGGYCS